MTTTVPMRIFTLVSATLRNPGQFACDVGRGRVQIKPLQALQSVREAYVV